MAEVVETLGFYLHVISARVRAQLQHRTSFTLDLIGLFFVSFLDFVVILIVFANVPQLAGWSIPEVALLYALSTLSFAFTDLVIGHLDLFPQLIRDGNFDLLLVRPRGTLFQVISLDFQPRRLGKAVQALAVLAYALANLEVAWTADRALMLVVAVVTGVLIFVSVWVTAICVAFWTVDAREAANAFTYGGQTFAQYPLGIYDRWMRRVLAYVVPLAFVAYFPALYVLGKPDPLGLPAWLSLLSPLVAVGAAAVTFIVWQGAVRHYRSAGG